MNETVLAARNIGQGLILVGDCYLLPGEKRDVPRAQFEAAALKNKDLVVVGETISQEITPPEPPAEAPIDSPVELSPANQIFESSSAKLPIAQELSTELRTAPPVSPRLKKKFHKEN
jgi:hypothetical protein